jgi:hypothetical protein
MIRYVKKNSLFLYNEPCPEEIRKVYIKIHELQRKGAEKSNIPYYSLIYSYRLKRFFNRHIKKYRVLLIFFSMILDFTLMIMYWVEANINYRFSCDTNPACSGGILPRLLYVDRPYPFYVALKTVMIIQLLMLILTKIVWKRLRDVFALDFYLELITSVPIIVTPFQNLYSPYFLRCFLFIPKFEYVIELSYFHLSDYIQKAFESIGILLDLYHIKSF